MGEYLDTPEGNLNKHIRATIAEFEREKIKERMTRGRRNVVKGGRILIQKRPPYGYRTVTEEHNGKKVVVGLEVHEPEARIIRFIFQWYTVSDESGDLLSTYDIADKLTGMNVPTWADVHSENGTTVGNRKRGFGDWSPATISKILKNPTYAGTWIYGKRGAHGVRNPAESLISVQVPPIIPAVILEKAQTQLKKNTITAKRNADHDRYLMRFALQCCCGYGAVCRATVVDRKPYLYYFCITSNRGVAHSYCGLPQFRADHIDALVWDWLKDWFKDPADLRRKLEAYKAEQDKINAPILALLKTNDDLIADNQAQLGRIA